MERCNRRSKTDMRLFTSWSLSCASIKYRSFNVRPSHGPHAEHTIQPFLDSILGSERAYKYHQGVELDADREDIPLG